MTWQTLLYFCSILLTCGLTGYLAFFAWRQPALPGVRAYAGLAACECLLALTEVFSMLSGTPAQALFWFQVRFIFTTIMPVIWLAFALTYSGQNVWLSKKLIGGAFIIPIISQFLLWSNNLHGWWVRQEVGFHQNSPFWIAETSARVPGVWFMVHSFYSLILLLAGIGVILITAWRKRQSYRGQALPLAAGALVALVTSLIPIFNLLPQAEFNLFIPGIGASAVLYALAIFRFQFLKRPLAPESAGPTTPLDAQEKRSLAVFSFLFILFASSLTTASYLTYQDYERKFRAQFESELSTVSLLKIRQLQDWRAERLADARLFYQNADFAALVSQYFEDPANSDARDRLTIWVNKVQSILRYERVSLFDAAGREKISSPAAHGAPSTFLTEKVAQALASGEISLLDFHHDNANDAIHLALLVPIDHLQTGRPLGVLVLRINPDTYLYPLIQQWPTPSQSAETLLVRREGAETVFLNPLRFKSDAALNLRISIENAQVPAAQVVLGQQGIVTGIDYRGIEVIADVHAVPESPWVLVAKMDTSEVYAPLRERLWLTLSFFAVLLATAGAGLALVWRRQRLRAYQTQIDTAEALRESEKKYHLLFDEMLSGVAVHQIICDPAGKPVDYRFILVNPAFEKMTGLDSSAILGKTVLELLPQTEPFWIEQYGQVALTGQPVQFERYSSTMEKHFEVRAFCPEPGRFATVFNDITERKQAEEELRQTRDYLENLLNYANAPIIVWDPSFTITKFNHAFERLTGRPAEEIIGQQLKILFPANSQDASLALIAQTSTGERWETVEIPILHRDGSVHIALWNSANLVDPQSGRLVATIAQGQDITQRKQAEAQLAERHATLNAILESAATPVFSLDRSYCYSSFNSAHAAVMKALYGVEIEIGRDMLAYQTSPEDRETARKNLDRALGGEQIIESAYSGDPGRTRRYFEIAHNPIRDFGGEVIGVSVFVSDITERRQAQETLQEYNSRLESEVDQRTRELREAQEQLVRQERLAALGQLAGSVGHELRNPLGVISNAIYFLKLAQPDASPLMREYLQIIENETRTSEKFIADLLDFTRLKPGEQKPTRISEVVQQTLTRYAVPESVAVRLNFPTDLPLVLVDPQHLLQVLGNLVTNACQAMPAGGTLTLSAARHGDWVKIAVQDTGPGVAAENIKNLFEPLFTTKIKGIGLGLAICKKLVEANQGRIEVESHAGQGAVFTVILPVIDA